MVRLPTVTGMSKKPTKATQHPGTKIAGVTNSHYCTDQAMDTKEDNKEHQKPCHPPTPAYLGRQLNGELSNLVIECRDCQGYSPSFAASQQCTKKRPN